MFITKLGSGTNWVRSGHSGRPDKSTHTAPQRAPHEAVGRQSACDAESCKIRYSGRESSGSSDLIRASLLSQIRPMPKLYLIRHAQPPPAGVKTPTRVLTPLANSKLR